MRFFLHSEVWQPALGSFIAAALLTPVVRLAANRMGMVAAPREDRWHSRPTALLGGVAIFAVVIPLSLTLDPGPAFSRAILPASAFLFAVGLIDDVVNLKPYQKLVGQVIGASIAVNAGLLLTWTSSSVINSAITMFWLIGITNAVNMLDNMDGLAAGVAAIASSFLALSFFSLGQIVEGTIVTILAAALLGFLLYNSQPASIFMGDCGSMFIGFFLASTALLISTSGHTRGFLPVIAVPVLTLAVPIFDATVVILLRKLSGRVASQGGRDHTSHRLVALGLTERHAIWLLWALALISGFLSIHVQTLKLHESVMAIFWFMIVLTLVGVYLGGAKVYPAESDLGKRRFVSFLVDLLCKLRVWETLLDACLIIVAYYVSWSLRFGRMEPSDARFLMMVRTLPIAVAIKIAVLLATGVYRTQWRDVSVHHLYNLAKSVAIASAVSTTAILLLYRDFPFSRSVILLDLLLLFMLAAGSRTVFRILRRLVPAERPQTAVRS